MPKPPKPLKNATFLKAMLAGVTVHEAARRAGYKLNSDSIYLRRQAWAEFQALDPAAQRDILSVLDPKPDAPGAAEPPGKATETLPPGFADLPESLQELYKALDDRTKHTLCNLDESQDGTLRENLDYVALWLSIGKDEQNHYYSWRSDDYAHRQHYTLERWLAEGSPRSTRPPRREDDRPPVGEPVTS
jgi:hypothetical protein